jgi:hypothetical protein
MTVSAFRNAIASREGIDAEMFIFVSDGAKMMNDRPLSLYISKSCEMYRMLSQRGC